jgi:PAS domain S-box-containing protein
VNGAPGGEEPDAAQAENLQASPSQLILLADDNADMREYVMRLLNRRYEVEAVADGRAALEAALARRPDLVLADVMMPELDGFGLLQELRADPRTSLIPVILLSARAGEESRVEGMQAGADDYLTKPFSARELTARVEAHLKLSGVRREAAVAIEAAHARTTHILESINDAFVTFYHDWRYIYINEWAVELLGRRREELLGRRIWEVFPEIAGEEPFTQFQTAMANRRSARFEYFKQAKGRWYENRVYPSKEGLSVFFTDITERKRAEEKIARLLVEEHQARATAETATRLKDEFLSVVSHELRSPLNAINGWVKLLRGGRLPADETAKALATIERNAEAQNRLIEDLLDVSRVIAGKLRIEVQVVDARSVMEAALDTVRPAADAKGVHLELISDPSHFTLLADPNRLQQAVWNLLSNAVKFTPAGGHVRLSQTRGEDAVEISVDDSGIGIESAFLPYVFERFLQADTTSSRKYGGMGLGLAIARHIVELHGGTIQAESPGNGQGATFTIRLPLSISSSAGTGQTGPSTAPLEVPAAATARLAGLRILIVGDEAVDREMLTVMFNTYQASVTAVSSTSEALATLEATTESDHEPFDLLISDLAMPGGDGYALIRRLRGQETKRGGRLPAIALTAYARSEDRVRVMGAGFDSHVPKPVEPAELALVIASLLQQSGRSRRRR